MDTAFRRWCGYSNTAHLSPSTNYK